MDIKIKYNNVMKTKSIVTRNDIDRINPNSFNASLQSITGVNMILFNMIYKQNLFFVNPLLISQYARGLLTLFFVILYKLFLNKTYWTSRTY